MIKVVRLPDQHHPLDWTVFARTQADVTSSWLIPISILWQGSYISAHWLALGRVSPMHAYGPQEHRGMWNSTPAAHAAQVAQVLCLNSMAIGVALSKWLPMCAVLCCVLCCVLRPEQAAAAASH